MKTQIKSAGYAVALMLSASVGTLAATTPAVAQGASEYEQVAAFDRSGYNHCDVAMLAQVWGQSHYQSKLRLGQKILWGDEYYANQFLQQSRNRGNRCDWSNVPLTYSDAQRLAQVWSMDTWSAKMQAVDLYSMGDGILVRQSLGY